MSSSAGAAGAAAPPRGLDFVARLRFWNNLPDVPFDPKMLAPSHSQVERKVLAYNRTLGDEEGSSALSQAGTSALERSFQHPIPAGQSGEGSACFRADLLEPQSVWAAASVPEAKREFQRLWKKKLYSKIGVLQHELVQSSAAERQRIQAEAELRFVAMKTLPKADMDLLFPPQNWLDEDAATAQKLAASVAGADAKGRAKGRAGTSASKAALGKKAISVPGGLKPKPPGGGPRRRLQGAAPSWLLKGNLIEGLLDTSIRRAAQQQQTLDSQPIARADPANDIVRVEKSFDAAAKITEQAVAGTLHHPTKRDVKPVEVFDLEPDVARWAKKYIEVRFDRDPVPPARFKGAGARVEEQKAKHPDRAIGNEARLLSAIEHEVKESVVAAVQASRKQEDGTAEPDPAAAAAAARRDILAMGVLRDQHDPTKDDELFSALYLPVDPAAQRQLLSKSSFDENEPRAAEYEWAGEFDIRMRMDVVDAFLVALPRGVKRPGDALQSCRVDRKARYVPFDATFELPHHNVSVGARLQQQQQQRSTDRKPAFPFERPACLRVHHAIGLSSEETAERLRKQLEQVLPRNDPAFDKFRVVEEDQLLSGSREHVPLASSTSALNGHELNGQELNGQELHGQEQHESNGAPADAMVDVDDEDLF